MVTQKTPTVCPNPPNCNMIVGCTNSKMVCQP
jgi:hypothetical protein